MLGKLFKYEFRATGRVFLPMYALLLVMSFLARLFYSGGLRDAAEDGMTETRITAIVTLIMVMLFTAVWVITLVVILRRFWVNLLGREGYLMNVLPVSPWEHVTAKMTVAAVWAILSGIASVLALLIMLGGALENFINIEWQYFVEYWNEGWAYLRAESADTQAVLLIVLIVVTSLVSVFSNILAAYAAMCIGQTVNKHRVWASIGAYFGIDVLISIVGSWLLGARLEGVRTLGIIAGDGSAEYWNGGGAYALRGLLSAINTEALIYLIFTLVIGAALFFVSQLLMKKQLNLQ